MQTNRLSLMWTGKNLRKAGFVLDGYKQRRRTTGTCIELEADIWAVKLVGKQFMSPKSKV